ncbi:MAG: hypothetical protein IJ419_02465 [Agathobacter sp.]|nr:hypothetical protein [Agathobacter sp.]
MTLKEKFELMKARGKNAIIYFDMDGVLAKWKFAPLDETAEPGFFYNLDLEPSVRDAVLLLNEAGFSVSILSAVYMNGIAEVDKSRWLDRYDMQTIARTFVPYGQKKVDYISKEHNTFILLDDYNLNLIDWNKHGEDSFVAVKFLNGVNGGSGTWTGRTLHYHSDGATLANALADIAALA